MKFSKQTRNLKASPTLAMNELSRQLEDSGETVHKLGFGQSPFPVPAVVVDALKANAHRKAYLPVAGLPALRKQIAEQKSKELNIDVDPDQVILGPGTKELIFGLQLAFEGELLLPSPSWVSYEPQSFITSNPAKWVNCRYEDNWKLMPKALDEACRSSPDVQKLLILNYPSNPTGASYSEEELKELAKVCKEHNILVCSDEIYGRTHYEGKHRSLAEFYPEGTIISGGLSKWCGAGGWRIGCFIIPKELKNLQDILLKVASETFSAVSAPIQYAAITAYSDHPSIEVYLRHVRVILKWLSHYVYNVLTAAGVKTHKAVGGFYQFPDFEKFRDSLAARGFKGSKSLCKALLLETGVALLPGCDFGRPEHELTARLSFVDFDGAMALEVMAEGAYNDRNSDEFIKKYCHSVYEAIPKLVAWLQKE